MLQQIVLIPPVIEVVTVFFPCYWKSGKRKINILAISIHEFFAALVIHVHISAAQEIRQSCVCGLNVSMGTTKAMEQTLYEYGAGAKAST